MKRIFTLLILVMSLTAIQAQEAAAPVEGQPANAEANANAKLPGYKRFYNHSGKSYLDIVSASYSTFFIMPNNPNNYPVTEYLGKRHIIGLGLLEWRSKWFGMQWLNFEFGVNNTCTTNDSVQLTRFMRGGANETDNHNSGIIEATAKEMWFAYRPAIKFYIPLSKHCAAELYGGVSVDVTRLWNRVKTDFYTDPSIPQDNFFLGSFGGLGFMFTGSAYLPLEIKCEYRHPHMGNKAIVPQGFYLTAQLHIGCPIHRNKYTK